MRCRAPGEQPRAAGRRGRQAFQHTLGRRARGAAALALAGLIAALALSLPWRGGERQPGPVARAQEPGPNSLYLPAIWAPLLPVRLPVVMRAAQLDLGVERVELTQAVSTSPAYAVSVAGRPALLRAFVRVEGAMAQGEVRARLTRFVGGSPQDWLDAGPFVAVPEPATGNLAQTLNFFLPGHWLVPGTDYRLQLDPDNLLPEFDEANNYFPSAGTAGFNFQNAPTLDVTLVPVTYKGRTPSLADPTYVTWFPERVYPVARINYAMHPTPISFSGDLKTETGWSSLLQAITDVHAEYDIGETRVFFGVVDTIAADGCGAAGCIIGTGWVNQPSRFLSKTAVGFAGFPNDRGLASYTLAHEMGHNFGRYHAPCPSSLDGQASYPYAGALIGQWGYDVVDGTLKDPSAHYDFMSYCSPEWVSDYTFQALFQAWSWASRRANATATGEADAWLVAGQLTAGGQVSLEPVFRGPGWVTPGGAVPDEPWLAKEMPGAPYALEALDAAGRVTWRQALEPVPMAVDGTQESATLWGFQVALPGRLDLAGLRVTTGGRGLFEQTVGGPRPELPAGLSHQAGGAGLRVGWAPPGVAAEAPTGVSYRVRFSADGGAHWRLLQPRAAVPQVEVPAEWLAEASAPRLEVQASNGLAVTVQEYPLR